MKKILMSIFLLNFIATSTIFTSFNKKLNRFLSKHYEEVVCASIITGLVGLLGLEKLLRISEEKKQTLLRKEILKTAPFVDKEDYNNPKNAALRECTFHLKCKFYRVKILGRMYFLSRKQFLNYYNNVKF